jgi:thioredoxin-like negative regulator of GroEL
LRGWGHDQTEQVSPVSDVGTGLYDWRTVKRNGLDGTRSASRLRLAQRLWETEQYDQAMNEWRSVLGPEPGNIEARLGLARAAAKAGDRAAAVQE